MNDKQIAAVATLTVAGGTVGWLLGGWLGALILPAGGAVALLLWVRLQALEGRLRQVEAWMQQQRQPETEPASPEAPKPHRRIHTLADALTSQVATARPRTSRR